MQWFEALVLGAIQGVTEFLPISSDGHLVVAQHLFASLRGATMSGEEGLFFNVMLHLGTLAAILVYYRGVARDAVLALFGPPTGTPELDRRDVIRAGALAVVATLPAAGVGLFLKDQVIEATASLTMAAAGFLVTATVLLITLRLPGGSKQLAGSAPLDALLIGMAQALAILPGVSRSGLTIATALALGFSRSWAVGFSLLIAVPAILGAGVMEIKDVDPTSLTPDRVARTLSATLVAGVIGYAAILWLIRIVRRGRLWYFSVYLIALASAILLGISIGGGRGTDAGGATPLDGPDRVVTMALDAPADAPGAAGALDRTVGAGPRAGVAGPGAGRN